MIELGCLLLGISAGLLIAWVYVLFLPTARSRASSPDLSDPAEIQPGVSVEVDCRRCGQLNRVLGDRLLDRPRCGRCKQRLMPKSWVSIHHVDRIEAPLREKVSQSWEDPDRLWACLADHVRDDQQEATEAARIVRDVRSKRKGRRPS